jgi:hypothetical protein
MDHSTNATRELTVLECIISPTILPVVHKRHSAAQTLIRVLEYTQRIRDRDAFRGDD